MLDSTGQIATSYAYDPFGLPVAGNGVANPWQFTGEAWDAGVELLYLRARYCQPGTGRFVTRDPWAGGLRRPGTLNGYVYVANRPVNEVDPTGLNGWEPEPKPDIVPRSDWGALRPGVRDRLGKGTQGSAGAGEYLLSWRQGHGVHAKVQCCSTGL